MPITEEFQIDIAFSVDGFDFSANTEASYGTDD
jgi:hypothetical protein